MPIYEYDCNDCKKTFSILKGINDNKDTLCVECGSKNTKKRISSFSCSLSGSGEYSGSHSSHGHHG